MLRSLRVVSSLNHHQLVGLPHLAVIQGDGTPPHELSAARGLALSLLASGVLWAVLLKVVI